MAERGGFFTTPSAKEGSPIVAIPHSFFAADSREAFVLARQHSFDARQDDHELADPLREDDDALEARFRDLEKRVRIDPGEK